MLFALPDSDLLYEALVARDSSYGGRAYVGVSTTGIFCRLTCPARTPLRQNCQFFETVGECIEAGFRACKRCDPMGAATCDDPMICDLLAALEAAPVKRWRGADIVARGYDPSMVRRNFRRQFGIGFLDMARLMRLRNTTEVLTKEAGVMAAPLAENYGSEEAFRTAFAALLDVPLAALRMDAMLQASWIDTPLGAMVAVSDHKSLHLLEFADRKGLPTELKKLHKLVKGDIGLGRLPPVEVMAKQLTAYFEGVSDQFTVPLVLHGTPFNCAVWAALRKIPTGETMSYGALALAIGNKAATRAVARANGANQIAIVIPCHRVIGADGSLTGYGGGLWRKQKLIEIEQRFRAAR